MTLDLDDLTQRLNDQVSNVTGSPDLDDLHARVGAVQRRRRRVTGGVTAAFVLALAAGSVVWSTSGDDAPTVSVADPASDGSMPDAAAPAPSDGSVTRQTPYGLLTVEVVSTDADCLAGTTLRVGFDRADGSEPVFTHAVGWGAAGWGEADGAGDGPLRIGMIALAAGNEGPSLTTIVNAQPGRYRATFADGTTDEATSVAGTVVIVGPSMLASVADTMEDGGPPDAVAAVPNMTLDRLADDGTVTESWGRDDLIAMVSNGSGGVAPPPVSPVGDCVEFDDDSGTPGN